jgi:hypothetical protein
MKKSLFVCGLILLSLAGTAHAALTVIDSTFAVNTPIPQGNPTGITSSETFQGLNDGAISSVDVQLNLSGGYLGGLYAFLVLQDAYGNTATEILLNQIGTSPANPFGSPGSGMTVTLSDTGTANGSIHDAPGNPTGTWLPDSPNTLDGTFAGLTPNGTWTLFVADLFAGTGTTTLQSWGLDVTVVPEPAQAGGWFGAGGVLLFVGQLASRRGVRKPA